MSSLTTMSQSCRLDITHHVPTLIYCILFVHCVVASSAYYLALNLSKLIFCVFAFFFYLPSNQTVITGSLDDDIVLLENAPAQAETLVHSLERAATDIGLHFNAHKTEYMCFNQKGDISTWKNGPFETSGQVHLPKKQCLINRNRHQHATSKGMDSYR